VNPVSVLPVAMGAVALFVGFWHCLVYVRGLREREHLYFAATCLGVALYDVGAGTSYAGGVPLVAALGQRLQHVALAILGP
jgi:hypothetical protein